MNTKDQKVLIILVLLFFSICISVVIFWPLAIFFISNSNSREPYIEFMYAFIIDLLISLIFFIIIKIIIIKIIDKYIFIMFISNTMLQLENANSNIQYSAPNEIYRDCIKSSKIMERIIGFNINGEKIFASFDEECDLSIIDELYRNKYCDTAIKIDGRILKIKKLTTAST